MLNMHSSMLNTTQVLTAQHYALETS